MLIDLPLSKLSTSWCVVHPCDELILEEKKKQQQRKHKGSLEGGKTHNLQLQT